MNDRIIYVVLNIENQKIYVGQTKKTSKKRFLEHINAARLGSTLFFHKAIRKYGKESFEISVVKSNLTKDEANKSETEEIKSHKSFDPKFGYNMTLGGDGPDTILLEQRKKISKKLKGRKLTKEHSKKISDSNKGRTVSAITKRKISKSRKGIKFSKVQIDRCRHTRMVNRRYITLVHMLICKNRKQNMSYKDITFQIKEQFHIEMHPGTVKNIHSLHQRSKCLLCNYWDA